MRLLVITEKGQLFILLSCSDCSVIYITQPVFIHLHLICRIDVLNVFVTAFIKKAECCF